VLWVLPLPTMAGLTLLAPLSFQKFRLSSSTRYALYVLLLVLLLTVLSEQHILAKANNVSIRLPGLKVTPDYQLAEEIDNTLEERPNVLVPIPVSVWLTTMPHHPYPLITRPLYVGELGDQGHERAALTEYIMGHERPDQAPRFLHEGLQRYQIEAVCFPLSNPWAEEIRNILKESGFEKRQTLLSHEIWITNKT
jgi:hypothetical protein